MKIYVVFGNTGDYEDFEQWPIKAYFDEEKAKSHVLNAEEYDKSYRASKPTKPIPWPKFFGNQQEYQEWCIKHKDIIEENRKWEMSDAREIWEKAYSNPWDKRSSLKYDINGYTYETVELEE